MSLKFNPLLNAIIPAAGSEAFKDPVTNPGALPAVGTAGEVRYVLSTNSLFAWNGSAWIEITPSGGASTTKIEKFTLSSGQISAKQLTLSSIPSSPSTSVVLVEGGPNQLFTTDYTISGNVLSWNGLGLESLLAAGEQLQIIYN